MAPTGPPRGAFWDELPPPKLIVQSDHVASAKELHSAILAFNQMPTLTSLRLDLEVAALTSALKSDPCYDLVRSSEGHVSFVRQGSEPSDRSARTETFDFHTDGLYLVDPPDCCGLFCLDEGRGDIPTVFVDSRTVLRRLVGSGVSLEFLLNVKQGYTDRRGQRHVYNIVRRHPRFSFPVLQYFSGRDALTKNSHFSSDNDEELTQLKERIDFYIADTASTRIGWSKKLFVVWDNYTYLHARPSVSPDPCRILARYWLKKIDRQPTPLAIPTMMEAASR